MRRFNINLLAGLVIGLLILYVQHVSASEEYNIFIDGQQIYTTSKVVDQTLYYPIRDIVQSFGCDTTWNEATQSIIIKKDYTEVIMTIGSNILLSNGNTVIMKHTPLIINGKSCAPIGYICEYFGYVFNIDDNNKTCTLNTNPEIKEFLKYNNKANSILAEINGLLNQDNISETEYQNISTKILLMINEINSWGELYKYTNVKNLYIRNLAYGEITCKYRQAINNSKYSDIKSWSQSKYKENLDYYNYAKQQLQAEISRLQKEKHI